MTPPNPRSYACNSVHSGLICNSRPHEQPASGTGQTSITLTPAFTMYRNLPEPYRIKSRKTPTLDPER